MIYFVYTIHVIVSLFLILVVLLQQGKGADLSVFGGGATQAAFGARGAVSLLHKLTVWGFVAFIVTTVSIGFMTAAAKSSSVMSNVPTEESAPVGDTDEATEGEAPAATPMATEGDTSADETGAEAPATESGEEEGSSSPSEGAAGEESGDGDGSSG